MAAARRSRYIRTMRHKFNFSFEYDGTGQRRRRFRGIPIRTLLPNLAGSLFVLVTLGIGQSIVWASSLSYLGLGAVPPAAEWGAMLSAGRTYVASFWWMSFFPGLFIVLSAVSTTLIGRSLQNRVRSA